MGIFVYTSEKICQITKEFEQNEDPARCARRAGRNLTTDGSERHVLGRQLLAAALGAERVGPFHRSTAAPTGISDVLGITLLPLATGSHTSLPGLFGPVFVRAHIQPP